MNHFQLIVTQRIAEHQAAEARKEEAQRERIRAEEQAKAEKEAREQVEREQREAAEAERRRIAEMPKEPAPTIITAIPEANAQIITSHASAANVVPMRHSQPAAPATPPTLTLGAIGTRLGFNLSADFLKNLGFEATKVKASCLYHVEDFPLICARLVVHIQGVQAKQAA